MISSIGRTSKTSQHQCKTAHPRHQLDTGHWTVMETVIWSVMVSGIGSVKGFGQGVGHGVIYGTGSSGDDQSGI